MAISETMKNVTYANGKRVATIEQTITRADDYAKMGDLYFRLSDIWRMMEADNTTEEEKAHLKEDAAKMKTEIEQYAGYLAGYEEG